MIEGCDLRHSVEVEDTGWLKTMPSVNLLTQADFDKLLFIAE